MGGISRSRATKNLIVVGWCFCGGISTFCYRTVPSTREPTDVRSVVRCLRCGALVRTHAKTALWTLNIDGSRTWWLGSRCAYTRKPIPQRMDLRERKHASQSLPGAWIWEHARHAKPACASAWHEYALMSLISLISRWILPQAKPTDGFSYQPTDWFSLEGFSHEPTDGFTHKYTDGFSHESTNAFSHEPTNAFSHEPADAFSHKPTDAFSHKPTNAFSHESTPDNQLRWW